MQITKQDGDKMLWELISNTGSLISLESEIRSRIDWIRQTQYANQQASLSSGIDFSILPEEFDKAAMELELYIHNIKEKIAPNSLFTIEQKNEFVERFFNKNIDLRPYQGEIKGIIIRFLERYENLLLKRISYGEQLVFHHLLDNSQKIEEIIDRIKAITKKTNSDIFTANKMYSDSFHDVLFLHDKNSAPCVTLANLFVIQKYAEAEKTSWNQRKCDLELRLKRFVQQDETPILFIEGDAGSGKSTLVGWINYHVALQDSVAKELLGNRSLITIRLRDLKKKTISEHQSLVPAILEYMHIPTLDDLENAFPNALVILDGFDELCMLESISNYEELIYDIVKRKFDTYKFIITTRPKYIHVGHMNIPHSYIMLHHFDGAQRHEWLLRYTSPTKCGQPIDDEIREFIERIDDNEASGICDTPMTLYMIASKRLGNDALHNIWCLYYQIFYYEINDAEYNAMFPNANREYAHGIRKHRDILFRINQEISYHMYCSGNNKLYLTSDEIQDIVKELGGEQGVLSNTELRELVQRCYGLCSYWKTSTEQGVVEFYHNNIRDFFLAEKIYHEMSKLYLHIDKSDSIHSSVISRLISLFSYGTFETTVMQFFLLRCINEKDTSGTGFSSLEYQHRLLPEIFETLLTDGSVYNCGYSSNPIQKITNIITIVAQIYRHAYQPYLQKREKINWWNDVDKINSNGMLPYIFRTVFSQVPVTLSNDHMLTMGSQSNFSGINFGNTDLRYIGFQYSDLSYANLSNTILCGVDFTGANLQGCNISNADMHYACLSNALLEGSNLTGVDLRGTELPDCSCSLQQKEQEDRLRELGIRELKI